MRSALFLDITQHIVVTPNWRFGISYLFQLQEPRILLGSVTLPMRPIDCPKTSVRTSHYMLCNIPEECRSHLKFVLVAVLKHFNLAILHALLLHFVIFLTEAYCDRPHCWRAITGVVLSVRPQVNSPVQILETHRNWFAEICFSLIP